MTNKSLQIRNVAFYAMLAIVAAFFIVLGPIADHFKIKGTNFNRCVDALSMVFGATGLVVVLLTIRLQEARIQKLFFLLAGGSAAAFLIALMLHYPIDRLAVALFGRQPEDFSEGLLLGLFPILFIIGAIGSIVFLIKTRKQNQP
jgi:hypothetical protein